VDTTTEYEHLAVLGQRRDAPRVVREQHRIEPADAILDGKVEMARRAALHPTDFAFDQQRGQRTQLAPDLVGELRNCVGSLSLLGSEHVSKLSEVLSGALGRI